MKTPSLSDFTILSLIGHGHYGKIILGKCKRTGTLFALKEMKMGHTKQKIMYMERMVMEWSGEHPFVLGLEYAFGRGRSIFLITKFMSGGDLFLLLQKRGVGFDEDAIRFYAAEVILALQHLHDVFIVHRDIKPENILLDQDGHVKLADMGLAKRLQSSSDTTRSVCGTDAYLAPEMISTTSAGHGLAVDVWQLGCLLFESCAGHPPFYAPQSSQKETHTWILYQSPTYPSHISTPFRSLLSSLLSKKPNDRLGGDKKISSLKDHLFFQNMDWDAVFVTTRV